MPGASASPPNPDKTQIMRNQWKMIYSGKCDGAEESTKCLNRIENDSIASSRWQQTVINCSRTSQPGSDSLCVSVGVSVCSCRLTFTFSRGHKTSCFYKLSVLTATCVTCSWGWVNNADSSQVSPWSAVSSTSTGMFQVNWSWVTICSEKLIHEADEYSRAMICIEERLKSHAWSQLLHF